MCATSLVTTTYLVAGSEPVHGADLVRREGLAEEIDGRHLAAEHALLVHLRSGADVATVERLQGQFEFKSGEFHNIFVLFNDTIPCKDL